MSKLSDVQLRAWVRANSPIAGKSDGAGLTFTLSRAGVASWVLRYRLAGKAKELTLGRYPDLTLTEARKLASARRADVQQAIDVAAVKREQKVAAQQQGTFEDLTELWLTNTIRSRHKHPEVTERVLRKDLTPELGKRDPRSISTGELTKLLAKINASGRPTISNDALRYLKSIFAYGEVLGMVDRNPAEKIRTEHAGGKERSRERALSQTEITQLFNSMTTNITRFGRENELAVKLLLTLGCRKMELFAAKWAEFDLSTGHWRIPVDRVKTGESRELPLPRKATDWLNELKVRAFNSEYVFPARRTSKRFAHVSPDTTWRALSTLEHGLPHFTIHDLRRTSRTLMSELGVPFDIAEKILGHKLPGLAAIYDRGRSIDQQKIALEKVAQRLVSLEEGPSDSNILAITGKRNS
jgi:integrase